MSRRGMQVLAALGRFSDEHPWSHNDVYAPFVLWHARRAGRGAAVLDVGCGTGTLLRRLARIGSAVVGLEPDARTAALARANVTGVRNVAVREEPFDLAVRGEPCYDVVTFVASLHHLPLAQALEAARSLLRPSGRLVIVGIAREEPRDLAWSIASVILNAGIGVVRHPRRAVAPPQSMTAPTATPLLTFSEVHGVARRALPGIKMQRSLFWRYVAVWVAPPAQ
ncbi:class I SAM-dependent methyltransferase [Curtobacterium sp. Leaf261]|uniref:class I SAM-dependent methyltransferase n=1 Tax=Curtobacterium sp. Leaf261 TaxID=1736311 RepID=UPI0012E1DA0F|nr:class I SAM-dependent methyltransferase [Curtobacterium sp. Leaf261]